MNETDVYAERAGTGVVRCWWQRRTTGSRAYRVVPDAAADIIVSASGAAYLVGPTLRAALHLLADTDLRGLRVRTAAIAPVLRLPGHEVRDAVVPLTAVLSDAEARRVAESVWCGRMPAELRPGADPRVAFAVRRICAGAPLDVVAADVSVTGRQLRRLFTDHTGLGPKAVQRVARFQRFVRAADAGAVPLAEVAASAGYADQAHLTRETRQLAGVTPAVLLRERRGVEVPDPEGADALF